MESTTPRQNTSPGRTLVPPPVVRAALALDTLTGDYEFRDWFGLRSGGVAELTNAMCTGTFNAWAWQSKRDLDAAGPGAAETTRHAPSPGRDAMPPDMTLQFEGFLRPLWSYAVRAYIGQWPTDTDYRHLLPLLLVVDGWFEGYDVTAEELIRGLPAEDLPARARERAMSLRRTA